MKTPILLALVAGIAGGAVSAGVAGLVLAPRADGTNDTEIAALGPDEVSTTTLKDSLEDLIVRVDALGRRLDLVEHSPRASATDRAALPSPEAVAFEDDLRDIVAAFKDPKRTLPNLEQDVQRVIEDLRTAEEAEREEQRRVQREERLDERITELTEKLGLDPYQATELGKLMRNESIKRDELMAAAREAGDFGGLREVWGTLRDETQAGLAQFLTPTQIEQYNESQRGFGRGGRGGGFDGGGRGGGGGGGGRRGGGN